MSLDIYIKANREVDIYESNITYNLSPMYYKCIDSEKGLKKLNGMTCKEALPIIDKALKDMIQNKEEYEKLNPKNGWGSYDNLVEKLWEMGKCCAINPDGIFEIH